MVQSWIREPNSITPYSPGGNKGEINEMQETKNKQQTPEQGTVSAQVQCRVRRGCAKSLNIMCLDDWLKRHYPNWEYDSYDSVTCSDWTLCPYCHGGENGCKRCHHTGTRYMYNIVREYKQQLKADTVNKHKDNGTFGLPLFKSLNGKAKNASN